LPVRGQEPVVRPRARRADDGQEQPELLRQLDPELALERADRGLARRRRELEVMTFGAERVGRALAQRGQLVDDARLVIKFH